MGYKSRNVGSISELFVNLYPTQCNVTIQYNSFPTLMPQFCRNFNNLNYFENIKQKYYQQNIKETMEFRMETLKSVRNIFIGSIVIGLSGCIRMYTNYANQIKEIFYFTQTNSKYFICEDMPLFSCLARSQSSSMFLNDYFF